ncbi:2-oxo-4-hydroxy-4-carboxy-5-ureidoimidazoline decarboxylase [Streptomyces actuosus]|uniref:2-oxo-4-hydroxy-4-carboxy-5-ureidoimidazoline decarboxylase n=1 Tax=Streptomyces actuosus TaxID=1885 RepID=A0ABS2VMQ4_STRAS|nr:2-oxo-4-hydroxy-4-carboxy-5-ureidoimidazoline decarboxylase [Streptomyces actuosus]MBN0044371.1 2-oxo-4-hydroxy-4-carboxy-5-ureidoimidazoline decarboxylase [Streptomyces actuosus]
MTRGPTLPAHRLPHPPGRLALPGLPEQPRVIPPPSRTPLDVFNTEPAEQARRTLLACLHSDRWAHRLAAHRPYPDVGTLVAASDEAAYDLTPGDLAEALAGESMPTLPADTYGAAHTALSAAHAAYEARFGHAFVVCLGGVSRQEALDHVLEGIRSRLANDVEEERVVAAEELRRLAGQRLVRRLGGTGR